MDIDYSYNSASDDSIVVSNSEIANLFRAWKNEKSSPEILPFQKETVQNVRSLIEKQVLHNSFLISMHEEQIISRKIQESDEQFIANLLRMEIDRIKYLLRSYLRIRLTKIEHFHFYIQKEAKEQSKLSDDELDFCEKYNQLSRKHLFDSFLQFLPDKMRGIEDDYVVSKPDMNSHVFAKIKEDIGEIEVDESSEEVATLSRGEIFLLRYQSVSTLLMDGKIDLL